MDREKDVTVRRISKRKWIRDYGVEGETELLEGEE